MAIPGFQDIMLPLLKLCQDEKHMRLTDLIERLSNHFGLTEVELNEMLPSGTDKVFKNRVGWARTYMVKAGLLAAPERGYVQITDRGKQALKECKNQIDIQYLEKFNEFKDFRYSTRATKGEKKLKNQIAMTPAEQLDSSYVEIRDNLGKELFEKVKAASPAFFEKLVIELLLKMGYGGSRKDAGQAIGRARDGGIDGIIKEDKLGLDVIYVQAKRWENNVGRPIVQAFAGSLEGVRAKRGILITTSQFSKDAYDYVNSIEKKIVLIDGEMLAELMIDHNVGVSTTAIYELKKMDSDYFIDE